MSATRHDVIEGFRLRIAALRQGDGKSSAIHHAMFKIAQAFGCEEVSGREMSQLLGAEDSYKSEWPKIRNLVQLLRKDGTIT